MADDFFVKAMVLQQLPSDPLIDCMELPAVNAQLGATYIISCAATYVIYTTKLDIIETDILKGWDRVYSVTIIGNMIRTRQAPPSRRPVVAL